MMNANYTPDDFKGTASVGDIASFAYNEFRPHCFAQNENGLEWIRTRYTHVFSTLVSARGFKNEVYSCV